MSCRLLRVLVLVTVATVARAETPAPGAPAASPPPSEVVAPAPPSAAPAPDPLAGPRPSLELPEADQAAYESQELGLGWALLRTVLVLGAVIALAYLSLNVGLRKLLGIRPQPLGRNLVTVLERIPLDQKRSLFVVRAAKEVLLIGGSENSLELITRLDAAEVERLHAEAGAAPTLQVSPFLQKLLGRKDAPPSS